MSRFVQLEGRLTLTGANADRRIRVRDSHLARVAAALAHELIVVRTLGPLAADAEVGKALAPFAIDAVAAQTGLDAQVLKALAGELAAAAGKAIVMAGGSAGASASGPAIELAALLLNVTLGAFDAGLFDEAAATEPFTGGAAALAALAEEMAAGQCGHAHRGRREPGLRRCPASLKFAEALAKVPFVVSLNDRLDETSLLADVLAPASHPFECWSDATLPKGLVGIQQPVIQPLLRHARPPRRARRVGRCRGRPGRARRRDGRHGGGGQGAAAGDGRAGAEPEPCLALSPRGLGRAARHRPRHAGVRGGVE